MYHLTFCTFSSLSLLEWNLIFLVTLDAGSMLLCLWISILMLSTSISQPMLVEMMLEYQRLVPVIVAFVDRLLGCQKHHWLGERLLQTFDEKFLPKVPMGYKVVSCFPIFDRIAGNSSIPPRGLLELLTKFMFFLVEKHGPDTGLKSWSQGSKVLGVCRTMLMHHHSSKLFLRLSRVLAFSCLYFPDLEVRDNARYDVEQCSQQP